MESWNYHECLNCSKHVEHVEFEGNLPLCCGGGWVVGQYEELRYYRARSNAKPLRPRVAEGWSFERGSSSSLSGTLLNLEIGMLIPLPRWALAGQVALKAKPWIPAAQSLAIQVPFPTYCQLHWTLIDSAGLNFEQKETSRKVLLQLLFSQKIYE